ncbi:MAG TPA: DUF4397 domain-containing protein [Actinomycetes bacterium]|nr:DUF4397 domain-containing protein [Actinomycetes bacterium]
MDRTTRCRMLAIAGLCAAAALLSLPGSASAQSTGWVRLAHLSPDTPSVDVYLYAFGNPDAKIVLEHVGYGALSPYQRLAAGRYTVAMRGEGADPDSDPVISTNVEVKSGEALTVAGFGRTASLKIEILSDSLTTPPGKATVRVIQASLTNPKVDVSTDAGSVAENLRFPGFTGYQPVDPGSTVVHVTGESSEADIPIHFATASIHTVVVLDSASGELHLVDLTDASGMTKTPVGGVNTGLGGAATSTAPAGDRPAASVLWIAAAVAATAGLVAAWRVRMAYRAAG